MTRAVIAFGANLGDREATIASATRELANSQGITLVAVSPVYETPAIKDAGVDRDAPGYLNGVVIVDTSLEPHALLDVLRRSRPVTAASATSTGATVRSTSTSSTSGGV